MSIRRQELEIQDSSNDIAFMSLSCLAPSVGVSLKCMGMIAIRLEPLQGCVSYSTPFEQRSCRFPCGVRLDGPWHYCCHDTQKLTFLSWKKGWWPMILFLLIWGTEELTWSRFTLIENQILITLDSLFTKMSRPEYGDRFQEFTVVQVKTCVHYSHSVCRSIYHLGLRFCCPDGER